jgi:hypothetical protein
LHFVFTFGWVFFRVPAMKSRMLPDNLTRPGRVAPRTIGYAVTSLLLASLTGAAGANLVLNGSFEVNTATSTIYNLSNAVWNATVANSTAFGMSQELDLMTLDSVYGSPPPDGLWKVGLHSRAGDGALDAFSLNLSSPVVAGQTYRLRFSAESVTAFDPGLGMVAIGISGSATAFGTGVFSATPSAGSWTQYDQELIAPVNGLYLTVSSVANNNGWTHVDNFQLEAVPEPAAWAIVALGPVLLAWRRRCD